MHTHRHTYIHTYIHTYPSTPKPLQAIAIATLLRARLATSPPKPIQACPARALLPIHPQAIAIASSSPSFSSSTPPSSSSFSIERYVQFLVAACRGGLRGGAGGRRGPPPRTRGGAAARGKQHGDMSVESRAAICWMPGGRMASNLLSSSANHSASWRPSVNRSAAN